MRRSPHLVFDISAHGLGHLGQSAPVIAALRRAMPALRLTVRSAITPARLTELLGFSPPVAAAPPDPAISMRSPLALDLPASLRAQRAFLADQDALIAADAARLAALEADLLVSNIGPLGLASARQLGVPAIAFCSLNWADMIAGLAGAEGHDVRDGLRALYQAADLFIAPQPHQPMPLIDRLQTVGPVFRRGQSRRAEICRALGVAEGTGLTLVSFGGHGGSLGLMAPRPRRGHVWLFTDPPPDPGRDDLFPAAQAGARFSDLLASVDMLVTKTGYGLVVEATMAGIPIACVTRPDWPEAPAVEAWAAREGQFIALDRDELRRPDWSDRVVPPAAGRPDRRTRQCASDEIARIMMEQIPT